MKKRDLFIVICLIAFGIIQNAIETGDFNLTFFNGCNVRESGIRDRNHPNDFKKEDITFPSSRDRQFQIIDFHNMAGHVNVEQSKDNSVSIRHRVRVYHRDKREAERLARDIRVVTRIDKAKAKLFVSVLPDEDFPYSRVRVYFTLFVPAGMGLDVTNRYGHYMMANMNNPLRISQKNGNIDLNAIAAPVQIRHRIGNVTINHIGGEVTLAAGYSRIEITDADSVQMEVSHCRVSLNGIKKHTEISYASYSSLTASETGGLSVNGRYTKIRMNNINGPVAVKNKHESMVFDNIIGDLTVVSRACSIKAADVDAGKVVINNSYRDVRMKNIKAGSIDVALVNGNLSLMLDRLDERLSIKNRQSKIDIDFPETLKPVFNIGLRYGTLTDRTGREFSIVKSREHLSARSDGNAPRITVTNKYGDLILETHSPRNIAAATKIEKEKTEPATGTANDTPDVKPKKKKQSPHAVK